MLYVSEESGRRQLRRVDVATGTDELLVAADYPNPAQTIEWASGENWVVLDHQHQGMPPGHPRRVIAVKAVGTGSHVVAEDEYDNHSPSISPDATKVLYLSRRDGATHVVTANLNGTGKTSLMIMSSFTRPVWSPWGDMVAFSRSVSGVWKVFVMNPDGTNVKELGPGRDPEWAPLGRRLIASTPDSPRDVFIYDLNTSASDKVTLSVDFSGKPRWSPDGGRFLIATTMGSRINIYHLDRQELEEIGPMQAWTEWSYAWRPREPIRLSF